MWARLNARLPAERRERAALVALAAVLVAGAGLRLWLMLSVRPALLGYPDSYPYIASAKELLFGDPLRPAGYPLFLRAVHSVNANMSFTTLVQHGLGLASALLLYLSARRLGVSRWWSLLPAGVVALAGPQVMIEHTPLTEALFVFLQSAAVYAAARAVGERDWAWALAAGALAGATVTVRAIGVFLVGVLCLWLVASPHASWRRRLARAGAALAAAGLLVGAYVVAHESETGHTGLTRGGSWNLYGRAGPFADCSRFDPPAGTRALCQGRPERDRPGPNSYIFDTASSPAIRAFGTPFAATQRAHDRVGAFARAAILHQPLDWLDQALTEDLPRYVSSDRVVRPGGGLSFDGLRETLVTGTQGAETAALIGTYYTTSGTTHFFHQGRFDMFRSYEEVTRVVGVAFVMLAVLALAGLVLGGEALRSGAFLFGAVALVSILGPPLTLFYDARYAIPAFGPLAAAAAVGGAALTGRAAAVRRSRSGRARSAAAPVDHAPRP